MRACGHILAIAAPVASLLTACASSQPEAQASPDERVVVGQGTAEDRTAIEASDQRMYQAEQEVVSSPAAPAPSGSAAAPASAPAAPATPPATP